MQTVFTSEMGSTLVTDTEAASERLAAVLTAKILRGEVPGIAVEAVRDDSQRITGWHLVSAGF